MRNLKKSRIGIFGGGQLARMLAIKGHELGGQMTVYSDSPTSPAAQVCNNVVIGKNDNPQQLRTFLSQVDIAIFESEFMDPALVLKAKQDLNVKTYPNLALMGRLQDRLSQKNLLLKYNIPTAPFHQVSHLADLQSAQRTLGYPLVLKKRLYGYDGYGTFVLRNPSDLKKFEKVLLTAKVGFIAEKFIPFKRELAVSIARSTTGEVAFLPLVESFQENSRCLWVKGPVVHPQLKAIRNKLKKFVESIKYVGVISFELFDTSPSTWLINEIAPRVHNSAHYSLDGLSCDQFSLHIMSVLGQPISDPRPVQDGFAMYNLLGESRRQPRWTLANDVKLYWYGKTENRPGRKMGHINAIDKSPDKALVRLQRARKGFHL